MKNTKQSKLVSLERPAQRATCVIDQLENRLLYSAQKYTYSNLRFDPSYHVDQAYPGHITSAILLSDGRLMIDADVANPDIPGEDISRIMVFNPDGSLSKSFNQTGILDINVRGYYIPYVLQELNDGSFLHLVDKEDSDIIQRVLPSGILDRRFGDHGKIILPNLSHLDYSTHDHGAYHVGSDRFYFYNLDYATKSFEIRSYTFKGKWIQTRTIQLQNELTDVQSLSDAVYLFSSDPKTTEKYLTRYSVDGSLDTSFGNGGTVSVTRLFRSWAKKQHWETQGSDYSSSDQTIHQPFGYTPEFGYAYSSTLTTGSNRGKIALRINASGLTDAISTNSFFSHGSSQICLIIDDKGKLAAVQDERAKWRSPGYSFERVFIEDVPRDFFAGSLEIANAVAEFDLSKGDEDVVDQVISDSKGRFYFIGVNDDRMEIVRSLPFSGTISGRAFADKNGDGIRQVGEKLLANQQIYVDENDNGKYDADELVTTTDAKGHYQFTGLYKGSYKVRVVTTANKHVTTPLFSTGSITLKLGQSKWGEIRVSV